MLLLSWFFSGAALAGHGMARDSEHAQPSQASAAVPAGSSPPGKTADAPTANAASATVVDPHRAQILADSRKLLKLSQELKVELAKSNKDTLSITVIKKAEEVEKLAKTLKEEMNKSK